MELILKTASKHKKISLFLVSLACILTSIYVNLYMGYETVYTHIFYLPIIMASAWFGLRALYLALGFGIFHILLSYLINNAISSACIYRSIFFLVVTLTCGLLCKNVKTTIAETSVSPENTEKNEREEQIALIGKMAVEIGHEIRNPLTTVRGFLQFLNNKRQSGEEAEYYALMIEELDKINEYVSNLISLSHQKNTHMEMKNLNSIIEKLLYHISPVHNIQILTELTPVPDIQLDEQEIDILILNILNNSIEAMPDGGIINVITRFHAGKISLLISDEGGGISDDHLDKIGTPFFTTKDSARGLGLATCYSIAMRHNAEINYYSTSSGTCFSISFLASDQLPSKNLINK